MIMNRAYATNMTATINFSATANTADATVSQRAFSASAREACALLVYAHFHTCL